MNTFNFRNVFYTSFALLAFAGNSILCRRALIDGSIDPSSFTAIRLISGFAMLLLLTARRRQKSEPIKKRSWLPSIFLFTYAIAFSFGYTSLNTGTGALILFGAVQSTMIVANLISGTKMKFIEWSGMTIAFSGFIYLVAPTVSTPSFTGFLLMTTSGIAWGLYTFKGRGASDPILDTHHNFLRTLPFVVLLLIFMHRGLAATQEGVILAILSGALASGIGYAVWYAALKNLSITHAAVLQLFVPIIATMGGVLLSNESITFQLTIATILVIGGIFLVILSSKPKEN